MRRGMALAQADVKAQTWRKFDLAWVEKDTQSTEAGAVAGYHGCYSEEFPVIVGPVHPAATTALIPIAAAHNAVLIIPEVGSAIPSKWGEHLLAISPPNSQMGAVAATNAIGPRQLRKAALLRPEGTFGETVGEAWQTTFQRLGGQLVMNRVLDLAKPEAWRSAALEAGLAGAEAVLVIGPESVASAVVSAMDEDPLRKAHSWFIDWSMFPGVLDRASESTRRRIHWVNRVHPSGAFAETYTARYQAQPLTSAGAGYDAIMLAAYAIEAAGSAQPAAIAKSATTLAGLRGAFGNGAIVRSHGVLSLDSAGYRIFEPQRSPSSEGPIFHTE